MNRETRYALYLAPPPETELWRFGCEIIGRDAASGENLSGFALEGYDAEAWQALTSEPRRYGFHATIKAPFRLAPSVSPDELEARVSALARLLCPLETENLRVGSLAASEGRAFVALRPANPSAELARLEAVLVRELDDLRAPMTTAERARRAPERLSARQRAYLDAWGYPYVLEEFRLHFTLTNAIADHERIATALRVEFFRRVASHRLRIDALAIFVEERAGDPFRVLRRIPLGSGV